MLADCQETAQQPILILRITTIAEKSRFAEGPQANPCDGSPCDLPPPSECREFLTIASCASFKA